MWREDIFHPVMLSIQAWFRGSPRSDLPPCRADGLAQFPSATSLEPRKQDRPERQTNIWQIWASLQRTSEKPNHPQRSWWRKLPHRATQFNTTQQWVHKGTNMILLDVFLEQKTALKWHEWWKDIEINQDHQASPCLDEQETKPEIRVRRSPGAWVQKSATVPYSSATQNTEGSAMCTETWRQQPIFIRATTFLEAWRSLMHTK